MISTVPYAATVGPADGVAGPHAATVAVAISDHGPFSPCVLTQRVM